MKFGGVCIETDNAPRLAEFYKIVLQEEPFVEGSHYGFGNIAVYDSGSVFVLVSRPRREQGCRCAEVKQWFLVCFLLAFFAFVWYHFIKIDD